MIRVAGRRLWRYAFRHVLFQRYLYEGLSELERGYLHEDVGKVLEELYGEETDGIAVQLARHFLEAGIDDKACEYLTRAGQQAIRVGAYREALGHLRRALDLLERLPETPETIQQELNVLIALGAAQIATEGQSSPEVKQTYDRALALCQRVGETPQLAQVLFGLSVFYFGQGQLRTTRELAERFLTIAQERGETTLLLEAHLMLGNSAFWLGDFAETLYHTEQIITLYDSGEQQAYSAQYAQNPRITCLTCATWATWLTGFPTRAAELSREALSLAEETGHPFNQAIAIETQAWLHQHRREFAATRVEAEKLTALTTAQGFPVYRALGTMLRGWALAHQGQPTAGLGQVRDGIVMWREMGFGLGTTFITVLLAEACLQAGLLDEGTSAVDEALASGLGADEKAYQAELYRLRGELLLARGEQAPGAQVRTEAATAFEGALDIARSQGAKMFELRATMSLCRLLHYQGDHAAAHTKLRAIYGGFTEGLETPDLQAAAALLDELASATGGAT
jgi:tetratricopeptide (TPR) repeat protein